MSGMSGARGGGERPPDLADLTSRFTFLLRDAGVEVTPERAGWLAASITLATPVTTAALYWLARVTLLDDRHDVDAFDRVFAQVWGGLVDPAAFRGDRPPPPEVTGASRRPEPPGEGQRPDVTRAGPPRQLVALADDRRGAAGHEDASGREVVVGARSPDESLRHKDFASFTPEELASLRALGKQLASAVPSRRSRRRARQRSGPDTDVRATVRRARRTGGEPLVLVRRRRRRRPRRLVLVCDISGSMEGYARAYLRLLWSGAGGARAETFVFSTRLTRLTAALRGRAPDEALQRAGRAAPDWAGGTRIGEAIKSFNDRYGRRGMARGSVVVVLSDGWDCGDPAVLGREMERLGRLAHRVIWVNPRRAAPGYAPLVAGMAAALPHIDTFVSGHSLDAFDQVLDAIATPNHAQRRAPSVGVPGRG